MAGTRPPPMTARPANQREASSADHADFMCAFGGLAPVPRESSAQGSNDEGDLSFFHHPRDGPGDKILRTTGRTAVGDGVGSPRHQDRGTNSGLCKVDLHVFRPPCVPFHARYLRRRLSARGTFARNAAIILVLATLAVTAGCGTGWLADGRMTRSGNRARRPHASSRGTAWRFARISLDAFARFWGGEPPCEPDPARGSVGASPSRMPVPRR
jgi:hypothetical protein